MTNAIPFTSLRYAESKVQFFQGETERWLKDHHEAQACQDAEYIAEQLVALFRDFVALDNQLQMLFCKGVPYDREAENRISNLFQIWHYVASGIEKALSKFSSKKYEVSYLTDLRRCLTEVTAMLNPSDELPEEMVKLRDEAIAEHARGETIPLR